jgi:CHAT domain
MANHDGVGELIRLWAMLPLLVGSQWRQFEPLLLQALEAIAEAETDEERNHLASRALVLCLPYPALRRALEPQVRRNAIRTGNPAVDQPAWAGTVRELAAVMQRTSRPAGDQWLTARFPDHPAGEPLYAGHGYTLTVEIAASAHPPQSALHASAVPETARPGPGDDAVQLTVVLSSTGAEVVTVSQTVTLPRRGASADRAAFVVTPIAAAAPLTLTAIVLRDYTVVQKLTMTVAVVDAADPRRGATPGSGPEILRSRSAGWPLAGAFRPGGADVTLVVDDDRIRLLGRGTYEAALPYSRAELLKLAAVPRAKLQEIVSGLQEPGPAAHQAALDIPGDVYQDSLGMLTRAGALLFHQLFFGPGAGADLIAIGRALSTLAQGAEELRVDIVTTGTTIPWHLLCADLDYDPAAADPSQIMGLRHRISYRFMNSNGRAPLLDWDICARAGALRVLLAVNRDIDDGGGTRRDLVRSQLDSWRQRESAAGGALMVTVPPDQAIIDALTRDRPPAELLYFFCHSYSYAGHDPVGLTPLETCLEFSGELKITLGEMVLRASAEHTFAASPLIVLNSCGSAAGSAASYESFLPQLLSWGARGVIGTEADVPPVFAAAWAEAFFARVLAGEPLGDAMLAVARGFAEQHRNLLGLLYVLHCDGRTRIRPPVPPVPAAGIPERPPA